MIPFSRSLSAPTRFQMEKFSFSFHLIWNPVKLCISRFYTVFIVASAQTLKTKSTQYVIFQAIYRSIIQNIAIKSLIYPKECKSTYIVCENRINISDDKSHCTSSTRQAALQPFATHQAAQ